MFPHSHATTCPDLYFIDRRIPLPPDSGPHGVGDAAMAGT